MTDFPVDYTQRDYASIREELLALAPRFVPDWKSRTDHDFGMVMVELFAYMGDMLSFYIDRVANETSLQTAVLRSTVTNYADLMGYVPDDMVPSTGVVEFRLSPGLDAPVTIPAGTKLLTDTPESDDSPLPWTTDEELVIDHEVGVGQVGVTQGEVHQEPVAISSGAVNQAYTLFNPSVVRDSVGIDVVSDVATTRWVQVRSLLEAGPNDQVFSVRIDTNDVASVFFGDGANGVVPPSGAEIRAVYREAVGARGNTESGVITKLVEGIPGVAAVTNQNQTTGGSDRETIDSIRQALPQSLRVLQRAVTLSDYETLALNVEGVLHAQADADVYTSVNLYVVPSGGGTPSDALVQRIEDYFIPDRALIGTDLTVLDPTYVTVTGNVELGVRQSYYQDETVDRVVDAWNELLSLPNVDLGMTITVSEIYRRLLDVPGVEYIVLVNAERDDNPGTGAVNLVFGIGEVPTPGELAVTATGGIET